MLEIVERQIAVSAQMYKDKFPERVVSRRLRPGVMGRALTCPIIDRTP